MCLAGAKGTGEEINSFDLSLSFMLGDDNSERFFELIRVDVCELPNNREDRSEAARFSSQLGVGA